MRICDWSSDLCSSDLEDLVRPVLYRIADILPIVDLAMLRAALLEREDLERLRPGVHRFLVGPVRRPQRHLTVVLAVDHEERTGDLVDDAFQIGRASL